MKKLIAITLTFTFFSLLTSCSRRSASRDAAGLNSDVVAISLKRLQDKLKACQQSGSCSDEVLQFGNIRKVLGAFVDESTRDLIIFGLAQPEQPALRVDDFVVALRSAWEKYNSFYVDGEPVAPGCTIDPDPRVQRELDQIKRQMAGRPIRSGPDASSHDALSALDQQWLDVCQKPQFVKVFGIPVSSHFAQVLVQADYDMKNLVSGTDPVETPGFISKTDLAVEKERYELSQHQGGSPFRSSLNRFWFYPDKVLYTEDNGVILVKQCSVKLLTRQMQADERGESSDIEAIDSTAQSFAENFTAVYEKVAQVRPIYQELENLFRFVALAKVIHFKFPGLAGELNYLLNEYPLPEVAPISQLPGRGAVKVTHYSEGDYKITDRVQLCGGVDMPIRPGPHMIESAHTEYVEAIKAGIIKARPQAGQYVWTFAERGGRMSHVLTAIRAQKINEANKQVAVLTVESKDSGYAVYDDRDNTLYTGSNMAALVKAVDQGIIKTPEKALYLDLKGFPSQDKVEAFASSYRIQQSKSPSKTSVKTFPRRNGSTEGQEAFFSRGIKLERSSMTIEEIAEGPSKGQFRGIADFFTQVGKTVHRVTIRVVSKSKAAVEAFFNAIRTRFGIIDSRPESLADIVQMAKLRVKADFQMTDDDLLVEFLDQLGNTTIVRLDAPGSAEVG